MSIKSSSVGWLLPGSNKNDFSNIILNFLHNQKVLQVKPDFIVPRRTAWYLEPNSFIRKTIQTFDVPSGALPPPLVLSSGSFSERRIPWYIDLLNISVVDRKLEKMLCFKELRRASIFSRSFSNSVLI